MKSKKGAERERNDVVQNTIKRFARVDGGRTHRARVVLEKAARNVS